MLILVEVFPCSYLSCTLVLSHGYLKKNNGVTKLNSSLMPCMFSCKTVLLTLKVSHLSPIASCFQ